MPSLLPEDLAPGDRARRRATARELPRAPRRGRRGPRLRGGLRAALVREFGPRGEMERRPVIADRLAWDPARPVGERGARLRAARAAPRRRAGRAARSHGGGAPRRCGPPADGSRGGAPLARLRRSGASRAPASPPGCARCRSQTARRCAAAAACAPASPIVLVAEMEPPDPGRAASGWPGCAPTSAPASRRSIRPRRPTRSRTSARRSVLAGGARRRCRSALVVRRVGRERGDRDARRGGSPRSSTRSTRSTACTCRTRRSSRCAPRPRPGPLASAPFRLLPPTA